MTDKLTPQRRSENMRKIQSKDTAPEMLVRRLVHGMGFRYRLHVAKLPGKPDLVFSSRKKVIEVRGCFWHRHNGCPGAHIPKSRREYWRPKFRKNKQRDQENRRKLRMLGWKVLELWECQLGDTKRLRKQVATFLKCGK